eukprot:902987-Rhodomonas_salina.1
MLFAHQDSFEDAQGMLETLLLLSALLLAFAITGIQSVQHNDLVEGDARRLATISALAAKDPGGEYDRECIQDFSPSCIASVVFLRRSFETISYTTIALMSACAMYLSLCMTSSRENPDFFRKWIFWFRLPIIACYGLFLAGIVSFFKANHAFIDLVFPMYDLRDQERDDVYSEEFGMIEATYWSLQDIASQLKDATLTALWTVLTVLGVIHLALTLWEGMREKRPVEQPGSESRVDNQPVPTCSESRGDNQPVQESGPEGLPVPERVAC